MNSKALQTSSVALLRPELQPDQMEKLQMNSSWGRAPVRSVLLVSGASEVMNNHYTQTGRTHSFQIIHD